MIIEMNSFLTTIFDQMRLQWSTEHKNGKTKNQLPKRTIYWFVPDPNGHRCLVCSHVVGPGFKSETSKVKKLHVSNPYTLKMRADRHLTPFSVDNITNDLLNLHANCCKELDELARRTVAAMIQESHSMVPYLMEEFPNEVNKACMDLMKGI